MSKDSFSNPQSSSSSSTNQNIINTSDVTPRGTPDRSSSHIKADITNKKRIAEQFIDSLTHKNLTFVIFDFDGTLTKVHTANYSFSSNKDDPYYKNGPKNEGWFSDFALIKEIIDYGLEQGVNFYICSKQRTETIKHIFEAQDQELFQKIQNNILGSEEEEDKKNNITRISRENPEKKILFIDDDPSQIKPFNLKSEIQYQNIYATNAELEYLDLNSDINGSVNAGLSEFKIGLLTKTIISAKNLEDLKLSFKNNILLPQDNIFHMPQMPLFLPGVDTQNSSNPKLFSRTGFSSSLFLEEDSKEKILDFRSASSNLPVGDLYSGTPGTKPEAKKNQAQSLASMSEEDDKSNVSPKRKRPEISHSETKDGKSGGRY